MLPYEIEPFAQAHIKELQKVREDLVDLYNHTPFTDAKLERQLLDKVHEMGRKLIDAERALYRFQVCMTDECEQKARYTKLFQESRLKQK